MKRCVSQTASHGRGAEQPDSRERTFSRKNVKFPDERWPDAVDRFIDTPNFRNYDPRHLTKTVHANEALTSSHVNDRLSIFMRAA
jgi:hypothetical protein